MRWEKVSHRFLRSRQSILDEGFPCSMAFAVVSDRLQKLNRQPFLFLDVRLLVEETEGQFLLDESAWHLIHCGPQELVYVWHSL